MMPQTVRHRCTNHQCETELVVPLAPDGLPIADEASLRLTEADVRHGLYLLLGLSRDRMRESARRSGVSPTQHGRALKSLERKLEAYLGVLSQPESLDGLTDIEAKRLDVLAAVRAGEKTREEAEAILAHLADEAESREQREEVA